jgi:phage baseplate assembly protein W
MDTIPLIPDLEEQINTESQTSTLQIGRSFLFDFDKNEFVFKDGKMVEITGLQALKQWINLCLRTFIKKYEVYKDTDFGCKIEDLLGSRLNAYNYAEMQREIREALIKNENIKDVRNIVINQEKKVFTVDMDIELVNKELLNESVVI